MLETANRLKDEFICLYTDIQHCGSPEDVIVKFGKTAQEHRSLIKTIKDGLVKIFGNIKDSIEEVGINSVASLKLREGANNNWMNMGEQLFEWLSKAEKPIIIFFDELPIFINRVMRDENKNITPGGRKLVDVFLSWLRSSGIQYTERIRIVVGGSIGIEPLLAQINLSAHMNMYTAFHLLPWDNATALEFINDRALGNNISFEEGAKEYLLEKLGVAIPHFVQKFLQNICWDCLDRNSNSCAISDVDRVYNEKLLAVQGSIELATYVERLERTLGSEKYNLAKELLSEAAIIGRLTGKAAMIIAGSYCSNQNEKADAVRFLLKTFEHDGYLQQSGSDYVFKNILLKNYWIKEFSFNYTPASQRP
ncbi:MAG: hypothetical protein ACUZ8H_03760, partial [Candidatus Anammoxibacter sp.]